MSLKKKETKPVDITTEKKIKEAARVVFHKKGFAATRTRDIAEEADINLALLNYYFRSKENLFEIIMFESLLGFFQNLVAVLNDETTGLKAKIEQLASRYIDYLSKEPDIPLFIMSEIRNKPDSFFEKTSLQHTIMNSFFLKQYSQAVKKGKITEINPLHFLVNLLGLIVFPYIANPMVRRMGELSDEQFDQLMQERKKLIPVWIKAMMKAK